MEQHGRIRAGLAILLTVVLTLSLRLLAPPAAVAFDAQIATDSASTAGSTADTLLLGESATLPVDTYLLGEQVSLSAYIEFDAQEFKQLENVQLTLTGPEFNQGPYVQVLPVDEGTYSYTANAIGDNGRPGVLDVTVTWDAGISQVGYGYTYGYDSSEGTARISYDIRWTPPYQLSVLPPQPPPALPGVEFVFDVPDDPSMFNAGPMRDFPQGLAYDGTYLYILVPANYWDGVGNRDIIIKTDTWGNFVDFIPAPGNNWETEAITFVGSTLYAAYNQFDPNNFMMSGKVAKYSSGAWTTVAGLSNLNPVGGLASDGTSLYVAFRDQLTIEKRDPVTGAQIASYDIGSAWNDPGPGAGPGPGPGPGPMGPPIWGLDSLAYGSALYAAQMDFIFAYDPSLGELADDYFTGLWDTRGLTFVTENWGGTEYNILYLAVTQFPGKIFKASIADSLPVVEDTPIGDYSAEFKVTTDGGETTGTSTFSLDKLTGAPSVGLSAPTTGFTRGAGEETLTVSGSIDDPSISSVTVGIALPTVTAFEDDIENQSVAEANWQHDVVSGQMQWGPPYSLTDLWHRSDQRDHTGGTGYSWRYGVEGANNFNTPMQANAAALQTVDAVAVGSDNTLTFWTWYDTEMDFWMDRKLVEASTDGTAWQPLAWIAQFWPPFQPPDVDAAAFDSLISVPPMMWMQVEVSLADYAGQSIYIRFRFDSMDDWGNDGEGWYIDDITISGAGFQGVSVNVQPDLTFSTQFTLAEGSNTITVSAPRTAYSPALTGQASVAGSLDTQGPVITLDAVTSPTNQGTQVLTGTVTETNFDRLTVKVNGVQQYSTTNLTEVEAGVGSFTNTIVLTAGVNTVLITVTDDVGLSATETASISYDAAGPVFEDVFTSQYDVAYKTGEISARPGDTFYIALKVTDAATDVASVKLVVPGLAEEQWPSAMAKSDLPEAVIDSWGIKASTKAAMNYVLPMVLPSGTPAGDYNWTVRAWDTAGNMSELTPVATKVVTTLEAFNIYLMPDWNLVSTPLIPTNPDIATLTADIQATSLFEKVWYYDASQAGTASEWLLYEPGASSDLATLDAGRGYWFKMKDLAAFTTAGKVSGPMASGLPNTPAPVKLSIAGEVMSAGAVVPPTYAVYQGWNLVGLHSEDVRPVSTALSSVTVPQQVWGSLLQYLNYISFPEQEGAIPEIDLGRFDRLISSDSMQPGRGYWLYMVQDGVIVP